MEKLTEQDLRTLEARIEYLDILRSRLSDWAILSEEEERKLKSVQRALSKYADYIDELLADLYEEEND